MSLRIAGVDPGKTTGVAVINWDGENFPTPPAEYYQVEYPALPGFMQEFIPQIDLLVVERFTISGRTVKASRQYEALYAIGGILFLADLYHRPMRLQMASDAKTAYTDDRLKELGWYVPKRHARDAIRHALLATHARNLYSEVNKFYNGDKT